MAQSKRKEEEIVDDPKMEASDSEAEIGLEVEVEDDTPVKDRGRSPLPQNIVDEVENDDLTDYSERVRERMAQLKKVWHDERREKEAAQREREEAVKYASKVASDNKRLMSTLTSGEAAYIEVVKQAAKREIDLAERKYRDAHDSGDVDKIIEAQQSMNTAQRKLAQADEYSPQYPQESLQKDKKGVQSELEQVDVPKPDPKALAWQAKNEWFGRDDEMTALAYGLHTKLVRSGVSASSDEYYRRIDDTMRKRFPENFEGEDTLDEETPSQRNKPPTVVAPATRSTASKKVRISTSALALSRKLGITPEQYALAVSQLENKNG